MPGIKCERSYVTHSSNYRNRIEIRTMPAVQYFSYGQAWSSKLSRKASSLVLALLVDLKVRRENFMSTSFFRFVYTNQRHRGELRERN